MVALRHLTLKIQLCYTCKIHPKWNKEILRGVDIKMLKLGGLYPSE